MGILKMGWKLDWCKFAKYLSEKYHVNKMFVFIGYLTENKKFYELLRSFGFILIFRPITRNADGKIKWNCDCDMALYISFKMHNYKSAVIVTSDGDFYSAIRLLVRRKKLRVVLSPNIHTCSKLLSIEAKGNIVHMNNFKEKLQFTK